MDTQVNEQLEPTHCTETKEKTSHGHTGKWAAAAYQLFWEEEKHPMDTQVNEQLQPTQWIERKKHISMTHR